eukprot:7399429-Alexandrium_andersonii.AAC.2
MDKARVENLFRPRCWLRACTGGKAGDASTPGKKTASATRSRNAAQLCERAPKVQGCTRTPGPGATHRATGDRLAVAQRQQHQLQLRHSCKR